MDHKGNNILSLVFIFTYVYVCYMVKFVATASVLDISSGMRRTLQDGVDVTVSDDVCADIMGLKWNNTKHKVSPCPTLVVWVPKKDGFTEFVKVNENSEVEGGFSIAIFCYALELLPYNVQPIFKAFVNQKGESNGTYDQLLQHIEGTTCEAVAGDVTIRGDRAEYVDFTTPYLSSEVYMLVGAAHEWNQTLWTFLRPFTRRLWLWLACSWIIVGVALAILEYRLKNPRFQIPVYRFPMMFIWFPISTFFFQEKTYNKCSKVVLVMWLSMIFIVLQIFTATLSSWLTLDLLRPRIPSSFEKVGYQDLSFLKELIKKQYNCSGNNLLPLKTVEDFKNALSNGSVNAIFDELPYVELFLAKYGNDYMKFGPINQESGIAFAFPRGSPILPIFSKAVINVTESDVMLEMKRRYLGFSTADQSQPNQALPQSLDLQSFTGLFVLLGIVIVGAIFWSEVVFGHDDDNNNTNTTITTTTINNNTTTTTTTNNNIVIGDNDVDSTSDNSNSDNNNIDNSNITNIVDVDGENSDNSDHNKKNE